ncbi:hypothetical protein Gogos_005852, partial [Gossypium gossypioides]|nr:hypothetical protein [Gossypium gossypioides]
MVEETALLHGIQFALEMGFMEIIIESDSKIVIKNIISLEEDYTEIRSITWDVKALARNFSSCRFEFIAREGNTVAHALGKEGHSDLSQVNLNPLPNDLLSSCESREGLCRFGSLATE